MLNASKLICFAASAKPAQAKKFYTDVLGLSFVEDNPFALVFDGNGTMLRIQKLQSFSPAKNTTLGWKVNDIRLTIKHLVKNGVRFERYDGLSQDVLGIWTSPSGAQVAWFKDPDGNTLSLTEF